MMMSMGNHCESLSRWARPYGVIHLVKHSVAGTEGWREFVVMQFCGLEDNLGFMAWTSGHSRGRCMKAGVPLEDALQAFCLCFCKGSRHRITKVLASLGAVVIPMFEGKGAPRYFRKLGQPYLKWR